MCLHAVAAEYFQLVRNDFAHRNDRGTLSGEQQSDLNVLAALAQIADGIETGRGMSEGIQCTSMDSVCNIFNIGGL